MGFILLYQISFSLMCFVFLRDSCPTILHAMIGLTSLIIITLVVVCPLVFYEYLRGGYLHDYVFNYFDLLYLSWCLQKHVIRYVYRYIVGVFAFWVYFFLSEFFNGLLTFCVYPEFSENLFIVLVKITQIFEFIPNLCEQNKLLYFVFHTHRKTFFFFCYLFFLIKSTLIINDYFNN